MARAVVPKLSATCPRGPDVDVRQLEALLAVAEEGSFTAAADRLHTVQSNVSERVRTLEAELGVQLLVRGRRGTTPTEFGDRVIDRARAPRRGRHGEPVARSRARARTPTHRARVVVATHRRRVGTTRRRSRRAS